MVNKIDENINFEINKIENKIFYLKEIMKKYARYAVPKKPEIGDNEKEIIYRLAQREYSTLRNELNELSNEKSRENIEITNTNEIFVNSYGEATKREITSLTFNKNQKSLSKEILKFIR